MNFHSVDNRYVITRDETTAAWRILDTKHAALEGLLPSAEVPVAAYKTITEGEFIELIRKAGELGYISPVSVDGANGGVNLLGVVDEEVLNELREQLAVAESNVQYYMNELTKEQNKTPESESFKLRKEAMASNLKILGIDANN